MKIKTLLFSASLLLAGAVSAQNLVVNGDFEAVDYVDALDGQTYGIQTLVRTNPDGYMTNFVPGWDRRTDANGALVPIVNTEADGSLAYELYNVGGGNRWDVFWGIAEHESMGEFITPDNFQYLDVRRFQDDGWGSHGRLTQTINVNPNVTYDISFLYQVPQMTEKKGSAPISRNVSVYDVADEDNAIYEFIVDDAVEVQDWAKIEATFTTPASCTQIKLKVGLKGSWKNESGKNNVVGFNTDNFVIKVSGQASTNNVMDNSIKIAKVNNTVNIKGASIGDNLSIINTIGQEIHRSVISSENYTLSSQIPAGIYVVKINNTTRKVVL